MYPNTLIEMPEQGRILVHASASSHQHGYVSTEPHTWSAILTYGTPSHITPLYNITRFYTMAPKNRDLRSVLHLSPAPLGAGRKTRIESSMARCKPFTFVCSGLRSDGFTFASSSGTGNDNGTFITKALLWQGGELVINADTTVAGGSVTIAALEDGHKTPDSLCAMFEP